MEKVLRNSGYTMTGFSTPNEALDTSETVFISPLATLKILRHAKEGIPLEVMGLMLGTFVDEYKIHVVDVFHMPQQATGVSVESVDPVFQTKMMGLLAVTGRKENVVGWYHSHPGFGCWLSSTDVNTAQVYEKECPRAISLVVDPVQSVRGKVVMEVFRTYQNTGSNMFYPTMEMRQTTSNECSKASRELLTSLFTGNNKQYYTLNWQYDVSLADEKILRNLFKIDWRVAKAQKPEDRKDRKDASDLEGMEKYALEYQKLVEAELEQTQEQIAQNNIGKVDPKLKLVSYERTLIKRNYKQSLRSLFNTLSLNRN